MDEKVAQRIQAFEEEAWIPPSLLKTLKRIVLVTLLVAAVVGAVLWQRFVSAPTPEAICEHKIMLTRAETQSELPAAGAKLIEKLQSSCIEAAQRRIRLEGKIAYARFARCVVAAKSLAETERC